MKRRTLDSDPSTNGPGGRNRRGQFTTGNRISTGNPFGGKVARFRSALFSSVTVGDFRDVAGVLLERAKDGKPWAVKLLLEYLCGPPRDLDLELRLQELEGKVSGAR